MKKINVKIFSVLMVLLLIISSFATVSFSALTDALPTADMGTASSDEIAGDESSRDESKNRYYFYLPKNWENEYSSHACIYWWENTGAMDRFPGEKAIKTDYEGLYYYDVPKDVTSIIWSNGVDVGADFTQDLYKLAKQTKNIATEYYAPLESEIYPEGLESFDNMVYVIDPENINRNEFSGKLTYIGEWFYYYGDGTYGFTPQKGEEFYSSRTYVFKKETKPSLPEPTKPDLNPYYTIYFIDTEGWGDLKVYYWIDETCEENMWPGDLMSYVRTDAQGNDIYSFDVSHLSDIIVFTNGRDQSMEIGTSDLQPGNMYCLDKLDKRGAWLWDVYPYSESDHITGDADFSGRINIKDVTVIQKHCAQIITLNCLEMSVADFDCDNKLNIRDATEIQKFIAEITEE